MNGVEFFCIAEKIVIVEVDRGVVGRCLRFEKILSLISCNDHGHGMFTLVEILTFSGNLLTERLLCKLNITFENFIFS